MEILELIQKDIKTLEKAVYSDNNNSETVVSSNTDLENSEDVLTRHLLNFLKLKVNFRI